MAELNQAVLIETQDRDAPPPCFGHEGPGGRPQRSLPDQLSELRQRVFNVQLLLPRRLAEDFQPAQAGQSRGQKLIDQLQRILAGLEPDGLLLVDEKDVVDAWAPLHGPRLAATDRMAREGLEFQGHMLGDMAEPGSVTQPAFEPAGRMIAAAMAGEPGQQGHETIAEPGDLVGREGLQRSQIDLDADHRMVAVKVRAAVDALFENVHGPDRGRGRYRRRGGICHIGLRPGNGLQKFLFHLALRGFCTQRRPLRRRSIENAAGSNNCPKFNAVCRLDDASHVGERSRRRQRSAQHRRNPAR